MEMFNFGRNHPNERLSALDITQYSGGFTHTFLAIIHRQKHRS